MEITSRTTFGGRIYEVFNRCELCILVVMLGTAEATWLVKVEIFMKVSDERAQTKVHMELKNKHQKGWNKTCRRA